MLGQSSSYAVLQSHDEFLHVSARLEKRTPIVGDVMDFTFFSFSTVPSSGLQGYDKPT